jgi:lipoic acid synthetase
VLDEKPDILAHNIETVPSLYRKVRPQARYEQSLWVLKSSKDYGIRTKSGIMVGLGETFEEVIEVMKDSRDNGVDIFTIGQYLQPTKENLPVVRYMHPDEFANYRRIGISLGFRHVESGPLVRSSYHAEEQIQTLNSKSETLMSLPTIH